MNLTNLKISNEESEKEFDISSEREKDLPNYRNSMDIGKADPVNVPSNGDPLEMMGRLLCEYNTEVLPKILDQFSDQDIGLDKQETNSQIYVLKDLWEELQEEIKELSNDARDNVGVPINISGEHRVSKCNDI